MFAPNALNFVDLPMAPNSGVRAPYGVLLPPSGKICAVVRSTGPSSNDDNFIQENLVTTLNQALTKCRTGMGDTIIVLPGHTENVTASTFLSNLVAGTRIVGLGQGSNMPVFRWTATGGQWALNKADVMISGVRLRVEGASGVTKAILCTAADNVIYGCDVEIASGAANKSAIALEVGAGATRFRLLNSLFRGTTDATTDGIKIVSAVDGVEVGNCRMQFAATEINGMIHITAAATNLWIHHNDMANLVASSTACIVSDDVASTGSLSYNNYSVLSNGTASAQGAIFGTSSLLRSFQCFCSDEPKKSGLLSPAAAT